MILAIDTSTRYAGVALWRDGRVAASLSWYSRQNHTVELMPAIAELLRQQRTAMDQVQGIAVALGPGGFSALRVGISAAKGLAMGRALPIVGVSTLECEAWPYQGLGLPVCPLLDMGRGEVAAVCYAQRRGRWRPLEEPVIATPEALAQDIRSRTLFCGEAAPALASALRQRLGAKASVVEGYTPAARLWALAALGAARLERGEADNLTTLQPFYLRRPTITPARHAVGMAGQAPPHTPDENRQGFV